MPHHTAFHELQLVDLCASVITIDQCCHRFGADASKPRRACVPALSREKAEAAERRAAEGVK